MCIGSSCGLLGRRCADTEGMNAITKFFDEQRVHYSVPLETAEPAKTVCGDVHREVCLPGAVVAGMSTVSVAVVDDIEPARREACREFVPDPAFE